MPRSTLALPLLLAGIVSGPLAAAEPGDAELARDDRIATLEKQVETLTEEIARLRTESAVPEEKPLAGERGYGPAASKVFGVSRGLSIGGYGELNYTNPIADSGEPAQSDTQRLVTYLGYKFSDRIAFNSEIEIEHARLEGADAPGELAVEFAAFDFLWKPALNFRVGLLLAPMGFINETHEPPSYYGVFRPETERWILPATWRENGLGIFGRVGEQVEYRAYLLTGFDATGFSAEGIREGRQEGGETLAENFGVVGRLDFTPDAVPGLLVGGSLYGGKADQNQAPNTTVWVFETHAQYRTGPFHARALFAYNSVSDPGRLSNFLGLGADEGIAGEMLGGYLEASYDLWPLLFGEDTQRALEPFARVEYVDTQRDLGSSFVADRNLAYWVYSTGLSYFPHPNVVLKAEYRKEDARSGVRPDEVALGIGFAY